MSYPYAIEEESNALIQKDTRTEEQKKQAVLANEQWLNEQGAEAQPFGFAVMQKPWVGLTDEQMMNCLDAADQMYCERDGDKELFKGRAIEAKLKEKNT